MRKLITLVFIIFSINCFSQTVTWAPDVVTPKETTSSSISFPGADANNYYVTESVNAGKRSKDYITAVDKQSLKTVKETGLDIIYDAGGKEYYRCEDFMFHNKKYSFLIENEMKEAYDVYSLIQDLDGGKASEIKPIQKINTAKGKMSMSFLSNSEVKRYTMSTNGSYVKIKPAYDNNSILSAFISDNVDKDYSTVTITEWDETLKALVLNNYKIPFIAAASITKLPYVRDVVKDNNGFCYILFSSDNPADKNDAMKYWIYQFKLSDPSYSKAFKKELGKNMSTVQTELFQDKSGKVYFSSIGMEIEHDDDKDDRYHINTAVIGSFDKDGLFQPIFSNRLSNQTMYNFASEKTVDKKGNINSLRIKSILPGSDGGTYVIWQHEWTEEGNHADVHHYDNVLVQYYNSTKKMLWEKPVYKQQANRATAENIYAGIATFIVNDNLCIIYPDDPNNADKTIDDQSVSTFSVVKFANKDLAGIFVATITPKGNYTRKYIKWPEDKIGYGICTNSFINIGNNEMIATARKIRQGSLGLTAEGFTFLKLKF